MDQGYTHTSTLDAECRLICGWDIVPVNSSPGSRLGPLAPLLASGASHKLYIHRTILGSIWFLLYPRELASGTQGGVRH